jgi:hypothetical protein
VPKLSQSIRVGASLAETWDAYFDSRLWGSWVDGFQAAVERSPGYPAEVGSTLVWRTIPAGRGTVRERVLEHEERRVHRVAFADPTMEGELETRFAIDGDATRVDQTLTYRLLDRGPIARIGAVFFVKTQVRSSMERTLAAFRHEAEERSHLDAA